MEPAVKQLFLHKTPKEQLLDLTFPDFIEKFNTNAEKLGLQNRIKGIVGSMDNLPFQNEEFDVIWSEGAIANIGFKKA